VITVNTESPLLDPKTIHTGSTFSQTELQEIPTTRDPWALLQATPGVLLDRLNVGGSQSGRQANYVGPGSLGSQSVWAVDGVVITDMAATGASPAYYDFDSIEEMQVTTGGADASMATGGVAVNLVTKRGTNQLRGSARFYYSGHGWNSPSSFSNRDLPAGQMPITQLNQVNLFEDYGAEIGGPVWRDHLWLWGAYSADSVSTTMEGGGSFSASIPTWNAKINAQLTGSNSVAFVGQDSDKTRKGVNAGPLRQQATTWDQSIFGGRPTLLKAEDTQIFSSDVYATALITHVYGGVALVPESGIGPDVPAAFIDARGVAHNTFLFDNFKRPQTQERLEGVAFANTGKLSHEIKFGASYRSVEAVTGIGWPGGGYITSPGFGGLPVPPGDNDLFITRNELNGIAAKYTAGYLADTIAAGSVTGKLGLRYDVQTARNLAASAPANALLPGQFPAVSYPGGPVGFRWASLTPRIGVTWTPGKKRQNLVYAGYSRYADQLSEDLNHAGILNPLSTIGYYYAATTNTGHGRLTPDQVVPIGFGFSGNINPLTGGLLQSNAIARNFAAPITDEILLGAQRTLLPELVVGVDLRYRREGHLAQQDQLVYDNPNPFDPSTFDSVGRVATRADYVPVTFQVQTASGALQNVTYYQLAPNLSTHRGTFLHNGDYETTAKGASLVFYKRLAHRWLLHGSVSWDNWYYSRAGDRPDPTILWGGGFTDGLYVQQGSPVVEAFAAGGPQRDVAISGKWSFSVDGLVQVAPDRPWGFNLAGNLFGRQGYPEPYDVNVFVNNGGGQERIQVGATDSNRLPNLLDLDGRIEKTLTFQHYGVILAFDCFNLLNSSTIMQRGNHLSAAGFGTPITAGFIEEIQSPREFRLGVRFLFK
jgi:hypothetical protein